VTNVREDKAADKALLIQPKETMLYLFSLRMDSEEHTQHILTAATIRETCQIRMECGPQAKGFIHIMLAQSRLRLDRPQIFHVRQRWPLPKLCGTPSKSIATQHFIDLHYVEGTAAAEWLRYCAANRKVAGSIPDGVIGIFH
jgi:hypothetical protein